MYNVQLQYIQNILYNTSHRKIHITMLYPCKYTLYHAGMLILLQDSLFLRKIKRQFYVQISLYSVRSFIKRKIRRQKFE